MTDEWDYGWDAEYYTEADLQAWERVSKKVKEKEADKRAEEAAKADQKKLDEILGLLYDLHKRPDNYEEISRLLTAYKVMTGNDKPGFMR